MVLRIFFLKKGAPYVEWFVHILLFRFNIRGILNTGSTRSILPDALSVRVVGLDECNS